MSTSESGCGRRTTRRPGGEGSGEGFGAWLASMRGLRPGPRPYARRPRNGLHDPSPFTVKVDPARPEPRSVPLGQVARIPAHHPPKLLVGEPATEPRARALFGASDEADPESAVEHLAARRALDRFAGTLAHITDRTAPDTGSSWSGPPMEIEERETTTTPMELEPRTYHGALDRRQRLVGRRGEN